MVYEIVRLRKLKIFKKKKRSWELEIVGHFSSDDTIC